MNEHEKDGDCLHPRGPECPFHFNGACKVAAKYPINYEYIRRENPCVYTIM